MNAPIIREVPTPRGPADGLPAEVARYVAELSVQQAVGNQVRTLRTAAGLTERALAQRAALDVETVRHYEHGTPDPINLHPLRAIAAALGTTPAALFDTQPRHLAAPTPRPAHVLLPGTPSEPSSTDAGTWRLSQYTPHDLGQHTDAGAAEPGRTVPASLLTWASDLLRFRVALLGSASDLTGRRSWYVGPISRPTPNRT